MTTLIIIIICIVYNRANAYEEPQLRVIGGTLAPKNLFPYAASIQQMSFWNKKYRHICTGSIVTQVWILTAAHCITNKQPQLLRVTVGTNNLGEQLGENHFVRKLYAHPWYKKSIQIIENDVGLVLLDTPITYSEAVMPIGLDILERKRGPIIALGWGRTKEDSKTSEDLQYVILSIMKIKQCQNIHTKIGNIVDPKTHICGWGDVGKTLCFGDSGSPLVDPYTRQQVGVFSGLQDCSGKYPVLFMRVSVYFPWISKVTGLKLTNNDIVNPIEYLLSHLLSHLCDL